MPLGARIDLVAEVTSPNGENAALAVDIKRTVAPRDVGRIAEQVSWLARAIVPAAVPVVASSFLSPRARELLESRRIGYIDTTGNVRIEVSA